MTLVIKPFMDAPDRSIKWLAEWPEMTFTGSADPKDILSWGMEAYELSWALC